MGSLHLVRFDRRSILIASNMRKIKHNNSDTKSVKYLYTDSLFTT